MKKRIEYIDGVKGFCMLLIVLGHMLPSGVDNTLIIWSNLFKISLFYFMSGYLFYWKNKELNLDTIKKLSKQIMLPYFIFSFVFFIFDIILARGNIVSVFTLDVINTLTFRGIGTLWFLPTIYFATIVAIFLANNDKFFTISIMISLIIFILIFYIFNIIDNIFLKNIFLVIGKTSFAYICFSISYFANRYLNKLKSKTKLIVSIILITLSFIISIFNGNIDFNNYFLGKSPILFIIGSICSMLSIFLLFNLYYSSLPNGLKKFFNYFGQNSLVIMIVHFYPSIIINVILKNFVENKHIFLFISVI